MFTRGASDCAIDSVSCTHVESEQAPVDGAPRLSLRMVYINSKTGITFGTCPVLHAPAQGIEGILSENTIRKFREFVTSAEEDFGRTLFGSGHVSEEAETSAEADGSLRVGLGGSV